MTEVEAQKLAVECSELMDEDGNTWVTVAFYPPAKTWSVRFITGDWKTTITEWMPAMNAVRMHRNQS
jgi:hypothetical protein